MELFKGINQIKLPLPKIGQENVNVYIIEGSNRNLMIDTGWNTPEAFNTLVQEMKTSGFALKDITDVVITHIHPDHFGLAGKIAEMTGARIYISGIDYNMVDSRYLHPENILNDMSSFMQVNGVPDWELKMLSEASQTIRNFISPVSDINILNPSDHIQMEPFNFKVILTPGHTPGHICLYETTKQYLFSGDHILAEVVPNISYHTQSGENPLGDYVNSLNMLRDLEVRFVFPGHGSVFSGLTAKIDDIMRYHRDRMFSIQKEMGLETKNAYDIAKNLLWIVDGEIIAYDKLEPIDRRLAVLNVLAHLQYLVAENKGKKINDSNRTVYWLGE